MGKASYLQPHISSSWGQGKKQGLNLTSTSIHCTDKPSQAPSVLACISNQVDDIMGAVQTDQASFNCLCDPVSIDWEK